MILLIFFLMALPSFAKDSEDSPKMELDLSFNLIQDDSPNMLAVELISKFNKVFDILSLSLSQKTFIRIDDKIPSIKFGEDGENDFKDSIDIKWIELFIKDQRIKFGELKNLNYDFGLLMKNYSSNGLEAKIEIKDHKFKILLPWERAGIRKLIGLRYSKLVSIMNVDFALLGLIEFENNRPEKISLAAELTRSIYEIFEIGVELATHGKSAASIFKVESKPLKALQCQLSYSIFDNNFVHQPYRDHRDSMPQKGWALQLKMESEKADLEGHIEGIFEIEKTLHLSGCVEAKLGTLDFMFEAPFKKIRDIQTVDRAYFNVQISLLHSNVTLGIEKRRYQNIKFLLRIKSAD